VVSRKEKIELFKTMGRVSKDYDGKIIKDENEERIHVTMASYARFLRFAGGYSLFIAMVIICGGGLVYTKI